ncbi:MAG: glycosyltransferase [Beijerinckiaceae bacterium]|nr:glycosyltransferase [Beijerinckiaceae bacterium]
MVPQLRGNVETIIIDSASGLQTRDVLAKILWENPRLRVHRLPRHGLSLARNAATSISNRPWLAFLDDDAVPEPGWVAEILQLIKRLPPQTGAAGLYTRALWPPGADTNLPELWKEHLSFVELEGEMNVTHAPVLIGANMLLYRQAIIEAGGFPEYLSRQGELLISGEDVYMVDKMRQLGWSIWYSSRPRAGHRIPRERLELAWFRKRMFWQGVTYMRQRVYLDGTMPLMLAARSLAIAPILAGLALIDSQRGTRLARAIWHLGIVRAFFMRHALRPPGSAFKSADSSSTHQPRNKN